MGWRIPPSSIFAGRELDVRERVMIAAMVGLASATAAMLAFGAVPEHQARDFTWVWRGARAITDGANPYLTPPADRPAENAWFMYPLTASLAVLPLAWLSAPAAGAAFVGCSAFAFAFMLSKEGGLSRFGLLLSPSFGLAVVLGQWAPLLAAAALAAPLNWLLTCKPIGLPLFLYRPSWRGAWWIAGFLLVSLVVLPSWPLDWIRNARTVDGHPAPVMAPGGLLLLVALLRPRVPEARLVAAFACVPQNLYFYDQLPLGLCATTGRRAFVFAALGWCAWWLGQRGCATPTYCGSEAARWILWLLYVPAVVMALTTVRNDPAPRCVQ